MKSLPLLNGRTANPSETSKRPVALSIMGSSSTRQTISDEGCSLGVMRICATALFSIWDVAIMPHIRPRPVSRILDLSLMDFSLMRAGGPTRRQRAPRRAPDQATEGTPSFCMTRGVSWLARSPSYSLETRFSCCRSEREPHGSEELFVVKRFGKKGRSSCVQRCGTDQWIVLSSKDDD